MLELNVQYDREKAYKSPLGSILTAVVIRNQFHITYREE